MGNILKDKKNLIIAGVVAIILVTALILVLVDRNQGDKTTSPEAALPAPEFLSAEEKAGFKLSDNVKAQVLGRDASGTPTIYRLINADEDIITDPSQIGSISPRQSQVAK